jgi:hypothetical protein
MWVTCPKVPRGPIDCGNLKAVAQNLQCHVACKVIIIMDDLDKGCLDVGASSNSGSNMELVTVSNKCLTQKVVMTNMGKQVCVSHHSPFEMAI